MKKIVVRLGIVAVVVSLACLGYRANNALKAHAEFMQIKTALVTDAQGVHRQADQDLAYDSCAAARSYLDIYNQGRLDGQLSEVARSYQRYKDPSGYGQDSYATFAATVHGHVRGAIERKLAQAGDYPITHEKVIAKMNEDAHLRRLKELSRANHELWVCIRDVVDAKDMATLRKLEPEMESKKKKVVLLLKTVS